MKILIQGVTSLSRILDKLAGLCMVAAMLVVVANVILRVVFKQPILGAYEYVGFLTALMIGFALAHCAINKGHIAVGFIIEKLPVKTQAAVDVFTHSLALLFWLPATWHMVQYGHKLMASGTVSATAQIPSHPFVYLVAFSLLTLSLVVLTQLITALTPIIRRSGALTSPALAPAPAQVSGQLAVAHKVIAK